uniref:Uncharacterized protein n=1 Tax=Amphimedon queenslandica TaxID=400682 RepID=A0A1X7TCV6_AMPQE
MESPELYGVDWDGLASTDNSTTVVKVNDIPKLLSEDHVSNLKSLIPKFDTLR